jgi:hypothetical protein
MSGWGCAHEQDGHCNKVGGRPCDPGMKGCVLAGRFRFTNPEKNRPPKEKTSDLSNVQSDQDLMPRDKS